MKFKNLFLNVFASGQTFASTDRHDPYKDFNFRVTITGKKNFAKAGFNKVSGLKLSSDVIEYRDGDEARLTTRKSAGLSKSDPVTMSRGMSEDIDIIEWMALQMKNNDDGYKATVVVELLDRNRASVRKWELQEAWISDYEVGDLDAQGNGTLLDTMILQYENMVIKSGGNTISF